jgi:hypothetical protein
MNLLTTSYFNDRYEISIVNININAGRWWHMVAVIIFRGVMMMFVIITMLDTTRQKKCDPN